MRKIKVIFVLIFAMIVLAPIINFNFKDNAISKIDNKTLVNNPFSKEEISKGNLNKQNIEAYINDRIGFREDMILWYTLLNDRFFGEMVHPIYTYGKKGYVFGEGITVNEEYGAYHDDFISMVKKIQDYCEERGVPFLFVFNPAKPAVLTEYLLDGVNYNREWVDKFVKKLEDQKIHFIDNTDLLRKKQESGESVFNKKYDANHWNSLGAYYGTNAILENLKKQIPTVHVNKKEELEFNEVLQTTLQVSEFPINEKTPNISIKNLNTLEDNTQKYLTELKLNPSYKNFGYHINPKRLSENAPRALFFQGSYMNAYGIDYMKNGFGEYIHVHNYQNIIDFPYYYNIFKPDCVVFEVAEYVLNDAYFEQNSMKEIRYNPSIESIKRISKDSEIKDLDTMMIKEEKGEVLTKITMQSEEKVEYAWVVLDSEYDLKEVEGGYETYVPTEAYENFKDNIEIITYNGSNLTEYKKNK